MLADFFFVDDDALALDDEEAGEGTADEADEGEAEGANGGIGVGAERADVRDVVAPAAPAGSVASPDAYDVSCALRDA
jgi:hypothetical protein